MDEKAADAPQSAEIKRKPVESAPSNDVSEPPPNSSLEPTLATNDPQPPPKEQLETEPSTAPTNTKNGAPAATTEDKASRRISRKPVPGNIDIDKTPPEEFEGEVNTNNEIPSARTVKEIEDYIVLDSDGRSRTFKTLYSGSNVARRVLVIFIRHFFCGVRFLLD